MRINSLVGAHKMKFILELDDDFVKILKIYIKEVIGQLDIKPDIASFIYDTLMYNFDSDELKDMLYESSLRLEDCINVRAK